MIVINSHLSSHTNIVFIHYPCERFSTRFCFIQKDLGEFDAIPQVIITTHPLV